MTHMKSARASAGTEKRKCEGRLKETGENKVDQKEGFWKTYLAD